ncbi:hypothetical protein CSA17_04970, partial [bacterium DOLJORAL78_65_58]
ADNNQLMATVNTDELGHYETPALTYYEYRVTVMASQFIPQTLTVAIDAPTVQQDLELEGTNGNILIVDNTADREDLVNFAPKLGKNGTVIAEGYQGDGRRASADIRADLETIGYSVELVGGTTYNYDDWFSYDLVVVSAGASSNGLPSALRTDMASFLEAGGKLLIEGGEIAYNHQTDAGFCADVLHIADWATDNAGDIGVADPDHYVMSVPNVLAAPIDLTYSGYGDSDGVEPAADAQMPGNWTNWIERGSVITYDTNPGPQGGQMVYFSFNYSAAASPDRANLMQNAVVYLTTLEVGDGSISGTVNCVGDNGGVTVTLTPGNREFVTDADGHYSFEGLFPGAYRLTATKEGWSSDTADVTVTQGGSTLQDLWLTNIVTDQLCNDMSQDIPDNDPTGGIYSTINMPVESALSSLAVYLNIEHPYIADLVVTLISPAGTELILHKNPRWISRRSRAWMLSSARTPRATGSCMSRMSASTMRAGW